MLFLGTDPEIVLHKLITLVVIATGRWSNDLCLCHAICSKLMSNPGYKLMVCALFLKHKRTACETHSSDAISSIVM